MIKINDDIAHFLYNQAYVVVSTIDDKGYPHSACKGIVKIDNDGRLYLLDIYHGRTHENLKRSQLISVTAIDEHKFSGFCLKGRANILNQEDIPQELAKAWEERITSRITQRVIKNMLDKKGYPKHPEAAFPKPKYLIVIEVDELVDLTPGHLK